MSQDIRNCLIACQNELFNRGIRGNFSSEENLHLTLAFIGEYPDPDAVMDAISSVTFFPIPISLDSLGSFGNLWWAGISGSSALDAVCRRIRRALAQNDIPFDQKRFSPHITILRKASADKIPPISLEPVSMMADRIMLYRSDRGKSGMVYSTIGCLKAKSKDGVDA